METHNKQSKDAKIMMAIMQDMGIQEYEPKVIHQMLEYTYRWEFIGKQMYRLLDAAASLELHHETKSLRD